MNFDIDTDNVFKVANVEAHILSKKMAHRTNIVYTKRSWVLVIKYELKADIIELCKRHQNCLRVISTFNRSLTKVPTSLKFGHLIKLKEEARY